MAYLGFNYATYGILSFYLPPMVASATYGIFTPVLSAAFRRLLPTQYHVCYMAHTQSIAH